ncbi:MAG: tRNA (adenosine(37)-N6)-threonylcarbamoyltransferase complex ATPase subunit type 1 TsaE [Pirellulaceae bacterium]
MAFLVVTHSEAETLAFGRCIGAGLRAPLAVGLCGTLGAGKTRLVQGIVEGLGAERISVTSPTFGLWQTYPTRPILHHLDAYRIKTEDEFWELGVEEWFATPTLVVVEWADRFPDILPDDSLWIEVEVTGENQRQWRLDAHRKNSLESLATIQASLPAALRSSSSR